MRLVVQAKHSWYHSLNASHWQALTMLGTFSVTIHTMFDGSRQ